MSFNAKLTNLLKINPRFVDDDGELVLAAVQHRVWMIDQKNDRLYFNLSEIDDVQFKVSDEDKMLNRTFDGGAQ